MSGIKDFVNQQGGFREIDFDTATVFYEVIKTFDKCAKDYDL